jgi:predicted transcriptional regulator YdeE
VGAEVARSLFDLTPPAGYTPITIPSVKPGAGKPGLPPATPALQARIGQCAALTAVVMPMRGSFAQTQSALQAVESYLKTLGVSPAGPPFGHYESEQHWDAGYPVPPGTHAEAPFELVSVPAGLAASVVVNGPWEYNFYGRWAAFLTSVAAQGYVPAGPPMEIWSGDDAQPGSQSSELRILVKKRTE